MLFLISIVAISVLGFVVMLIKEEDDNTKKILLVNIIVSGVIMITTFLVITLDDINILDIIFLYILLTPVGLIGIWTYCKYGHDFIKVNDETNK